MTKYALKLLLSLMIAILISNIGLANDYYVGETGQDTLGFGNNPDSPFRSITYALFVADSSVGHPHNIYIANGTYDDGFETFPLPMTDETHLIGNDVDNTIIDGFESLSNVIFANFTSDWSLKNLTITNGNAIEGGGISIYQASNVLIENVIIRNNRADFPLFPQTQGRGGGMMIFESDDVVLRNVLFDENTAYDHGGALAVINCSPIFDHLTIVKNSADQDLNSGAIYFSGTNQHTIQIENSIIWANPLSDIPQLSIIVPPAVNQSVTYNIIENNDYTPFPGEGNICADPMFVDEPRSDYQVLPGSPAVDQGNPDSPYNNEPLPNGDRTNCGYLGNTALTQKSGAQIDFRRNEWSLIGIPVDPEENDPAELFGDDFDNSDPSEETWRLQRWDNESSQLLRYNEVEEDGIEHGDPPAIEPGVGFLIRQSLDNIRTAQVPGHIASQRESINIPLTAGEGKQFHTIANPYPYNINVSDMVISVNNIEYNLDDAASAGLINRWIYKLGQGQQFIPSLGVLNPWEGAVLVSLGAPDIELVINPQRNTSELGDAYIDATWALRANVAAINSDGEYTSSSNGHIFGIGPSMQNGYDHYDALSIDWVPSDLSFQWKGPDHPPLYHSFLNDSTGGDWRIWYADIWAKEDTLRTLPDFADFYIEGIINEEGEDPFPPEGYNLWLTDANSEDYEVLLPDLRDSSIIRLPFEDIPGVGKRLQVMIWCSREDWDEVAVEEKNNLLPGKFQIKSIYPNPFNSTTNLSFEIPEPGNVDLKVFDVLGREVDIITQAHYSAGIHRLSWKADNLASSVYFVRLNSNGKQDIRKIVLVR